MEVMANSWRWRAAPLGRSWTNLNTSDASIRVRLWKKLVDDGYGTDATAFSPSPS
jgi:hypothetical protein